MPCTAQGFGVGQMLRAYAIQDDCQGLGGQSVHAVHMGSRALDVHGLFYLAVTRSREFVEAVDMKAWQMGM
jgi:hypothetical protein